MQEVGSSCTIESTGTEGKGAFRNAVLANVDGEYRLLVQTQRGWFGRTVVSQGAAEAVRVDFVSITDRVFDKGDDLYVELTQTEDSSSTTFAMLCVALKGVPRCTEPIVRSIDFDYGEVQRYRQNWTFERNGRVTRTLSNTVGISADDQKTLTTPFQLRFAN